MIALLGATTQGLAAEGATNEPVELTILHTNDHHGRFWRNKHGEYGMAARKTLIDRIRDEVAEKKGETATLFRGRYQHGRS